MIHQCKVDNIYIYIFGDLGRPKDQFWKFKKMTEPGTEPVEKSPEPDQWWRRARVGRAQISERAQGRVSKDMDKQE